LSLERFHFINRVESWTLALYQFLGADDAMAHRTPQYANVNTKQIPLT
jgi:hypothetical protein